MFAVLVPRIDFGSLLPDWDRTTPFWLVSAVLVTMLGVVVSALRWEAVLVALDVRIRARTLLHHLAAGLFVGNFLPSTIGGDVLRIRRLARDVGEWTVPFASVVLDRLSGMLVLPVITLAALAVNPGLRELGTASLVAALISGVTLLLLAGLLFATGHPGFGGRFTGTSRFHRVAAAVHLGAARFRHHPRAAAGIVLAGFAYQLLMVLAAFLAARALGLDEVRLTAALAFVPAVAIVQVIPISLGGLGIREGAFVLFLHPLGVPTGRAVALGLLIYLLNLAASLLGAPSFALGGRSDDRVSA
jgi:glycosyltransferase 2 family protein